MSHHIFTYGSLMFAPVWQRVVRGNYRSANAIVSGYARFQIVGETYPAMVAQDNASVAGVVYFNVDLQDVALLDCFEGSDYRRDRLAASTDANETHPVEAYIYTDASRLADSPWQPATFELQRFLEAYCAIRPEQ